MAAKTAAQGAACDPRPAYDVLPLSFFPFAALNQGLNLAPQFL